MLSLPTQEGSDDQEDGHNTSKLSIFDNRNYLYNTAMFLQRFGSYPLLWVSTGLQLIPHQYSTFLLGQ